MVGKLCGRMPEAVGKGGWMGAVVSGDVLVVEQEGCSSGWVKWLWCDGMLMRWWGSMTPFVLRYVGIVL